MLTEQLTAGPAGTSGASPETRWPGRMCLVAAPFRPATTALRTRHVPLLTAWGIHLLSALLAVFAVFVLAALSEVRTGRGLLDRVVHLLIEIIEEISRDPDEAMAIVGIFIVMIELGFVALGLVQAPWGARVEPIRTSIAHGLRRVWLQTPHILWGILIVGLPAVMIIRAQSAWHTSHPIQFFPPIPAPGPNATQQEIQAFQQAQQAAMETWEERYEAYRASRPFYVRHAEALIAALSFAAGLWLLWALFRAIGAPRDSEQITQPPLCEFCGYNLSTMPMEALCPECGQPVIESLGVHVRQGTAWQQRARLGRVRACWESCMGAVLAPTSLGRELRIYTPGTDHRTLLAAVIVLIGVISWPGFVFVVYMSNPSGAPGVVERDPEIIWVGAFIGVLVATAALLSLCLLAGAVGLDRYARDRRNLLPACIQAASYLSPALLVGLAFAWLSGAYAASEPEHLRRYARGMQLNSEIFLFLLWAAVNLIWAGLFLLTLWRVVAAARFANR